MRPRQIPHYIWTCVPEERNAIRWPITQDSIFTNEYGFLAFRSTIPDIEVTLSLGEWEKTYVLNTSEYNPDRSYRIYFHPRIGELSPPTGSFNTVISINGPYEDYATLDQNEQIPLSEDIKGNVLTITFNDPSAITRLSIYYLKSQEFPTGLDYHTNVEILNITALAPLMTTLPEYLFNMTNITNLTLDRIVDETSLLGKSIPNELLNMNLSVFNWTFADETRNRIVSNIDSLALFSELTLFRFNPSGTAYFLGDWAKTSKLNQIQYSLSDRYREVSPETNPMINFDPVLKECPSIKQLYYYANVLNSNILSTFDSTYVDRLDILDRGNNTETALQSITGIANIVDYLLPFGVGALKYITFSAQKDQGWQFADEFMQEIVTQFYNSVAAKVTQTGISDLSTVTLKLSIVYGVTNQPLDGTYQQPTDWDGTNGTPQSSLERLWVLANKYNINITYTS